MKTRFSLILMICFFAADAQQKKTPATNQLYYFIAKGNLVGVKNGAGKIIIPVRHSYLDYDTKKPISGKLIYIESDKKNPGNQHTSGGVYDRTGKFLFNPLTFDNGPDYWSEGLSRFVKDDKIGFVNRNGEVVIDAKYDYAEGINYGVISYCEGCTWKWKGEHQFVSGGTISYINKDGKELQVLDKPKGPNDQQVSSSKYVAYPFVYTEHEQQLLDTFRKLPQISKAFFVNYTSPRDSNERSLHFEIIERPSESFKYYHVKGFQFYEDRGYYGDPFDLSFFINPTTNKIYYRRYSDDDLIPFDKWLKDFIREAKEYSKKHPEALYKYN